MFKLFWDNGLKQMFVLDYLQMLGDHCISYYIFRTAQSAVIFSIF